MSRRRAPAYRPADSRAAETWGPLAALLAAPPDQAEALVDGVQQVVLGKQIQRDLDLAGSLAIVYAPSPTAAAIGAVKLLDAWRAAPDRVWDGMLLARRSGMTRAEYDAWVGGAPEVVAVRVKEATRMAPIPLAELRTLTGASPRLGAWRQLSTSDLQAVLDRWEVELWTGTV